MLVNPPSQPDDEQKRIISRRIAEVIFENPDFEEKLKEIGDDSEAFFQLVVDTCKENGCDFTVDEVKSAAVRPPTTLGCFDNGSYLWCPL